MCGAPEANVSPAQPRLLRLLSTGSPQPRPQAPLPPLCFSQAHWAALVRATTAFAVSRARIDDYEASGETLGTSVLSLASVSRGDRGQLRTLMGDAWCSRSTVTVTHGVFPLSQSEQSRLVSPENFG